MKEFCPPMSYCYKAVGKDEYICDTTIQQYFSMNGLGIAVSIKPGYVHLFKASTFPICDTTIQQYFSMNGLCIAVSIKPGYVHLFKASTFPHQTCVCMAFKLDDTVVINNNNDNHSMDACGRVGGKHEYRQES